MTQPGESSIERAVLRVLQEQGSSSLSYLCRRISKGTVDQLREVAESLVHQGLAKQSLAGRHPIEDCWDITNAGRAEA